MRIAITADLHYGGSRGRGDVPTRLLAAFLYDQPPDVLILAGDVGTEEHFGTCLALFEKLPGRKAVLPGNHDIWVTSDDQRGDSLCVYHEHLPRISAEHGFHYLDHGPLLLDASLAVVGSINWYDYSWSYDRLCADLPVEAVEAMLKNKHFSRGRHNDARFVRWPLDDRRFTAEVVATLERHLTEALSAAEGAIVVTHHPPFYGLNYPNDTEPPDRDRLLWEAFSGNRALEEVLARHAERIPFIFCGHTHYARENMLGPSRGYNVGGDYPWKRLLLLDWPAGTVETHTFEHPEA